MVRAEIGEKPAWILYAKALGFFLVSYCAIEAGRTFLVAGFQDTSFRYYGGLIAIGVILLLATLIYEKIWERPPIKSHSS